jgi:hypothetical protein
MAEQSRDGYAPFEDPEFDRSCPIREDDPRVSELVRWAREKSLTAADVDGVVYDVLGALRYRRLARRGELPKSGWIAKDIGDEESDRLASKVNRLGIVAQFRVLVAAVDDAPDAAERVQALVDAESLWESPDFLEDAAKERAA